MHSNKVIYHQGAGWRGLWATFVSDIESRLIYNFKRVLNFFIDFYKKLLYNIYIS